MPTLNYALSYLFLPPLGFAWLALAAMLISYRLHRKRGLAVGIALVAVALLLVLSMPAVATRLLISLEAGLPVQPSTQSPPQAIVILSGDAKLSTGGFVAGPMTLERLLGGARVYRRTGLPVLVSGGMVTEGRYHATLATLMARVLEEDFRVPVRWREAKSKTTWENAKYSAAILLPLGIRSVYLVSNAWDARRGIMAFRHFGMNPIAASVAFDAVDGGGFVPSPTSLAHSFDALHEWLGLLYYDFRAWRSGPVPSPAASVPEKSAS